MSARSGSQSILIVDPVCQQPYSDAPLTHLGLGGTEGTVLRVARGLVARGHRVCVAQSCREVGEVGEDGVTYIPYRHRQGAPRLAADAVILVRGAKLLRGLRRVHPEARLFLWLHCFPGARRWRIGQWARQARATVLTVSEHHRARVIERVAARDPLSARALSIEAVYNPLAEGLTPAPEGAWDPDRLLFLSSPHKGLDEVLACFARARERFPSMTLRVADPGYLRSDRRAMPDGVVPLGVLSHDEAMDEARRALCLFYPQQRFAETFGLVLAEANAVGTPALAHPLGAAPEVLARCPRQLIDAGDHAQVIERLARWRAGARPRVRVDPRFTLDAVLDRWQDLLASQPHPWRVNRTALHAARAAAPPLRMTHVMASRAGRSARRAPLTHAATAQDAPPLAESPAEAAE